MAAPSGRQFVSATDEKSTSTVLFHAALPVPGIFIPVLFAADLHPEFRISGFGMRSRNELPHPVDDLGMLCGKVVFLAGIVTEVE